MQLSIKADFKGVQRQLDALQKDIAQKATVSAVNKTVAQAQTAMSKAIREEFNISAGKVREKLFIRRASFKQGRLSVEASLESRTPGGKRRSINLINFAARETSRGLTVKIKKSGGRKLASSRGFIGNKGRTAFKRTGKARLPIQPLQVIDVPQMFNTKRINAAVVAKIRAVFPVVFEREAAFFLRKFGSAR